MNKVTITPPTHEASRGTYRNFPPGSICEIVSGDYTGNIVMIAFRASDSAFMNLKTGDTWGKENTIELERLAPGTVVHLEVQ